MNLNNQVAIVTGGGQGIGQQIALRLAREGAIVIIADVNARGGDETVQMINSEHGQRATLSVTDITSEADVTRLVQHSLIIANRIDILVNNSGIAGPIKSIEDITAEEWDLTLGVNLRGMFFCCKHVIPIMKKENRGSIVNIASVSGKQPLPQRLPYATSKMGVIGLTRTLAAEVGQWNIRVNAVSPGAVDGPRLRLVWGKHMASGKTWDQVVAEKCEAIPLRTLINPKFIASVVAFLCSEDAAMMTGQDINVSAGNVMY